MRRWGWLVIGVLLVGCAGSPDTQATQTRTAEIATNTVLAGVLPTQNALVPPTPVPTTGAPRAGTDTQGPIYPSTVAPGAPSVQQVRLTQVASIRPVTLVPPVNISATAVSLRPPHPASPPISGSWVASSSVIHVRFFAPPSLVENPEINSAHRYSLSSPSNIYDFEALDVYRFPGARGGDFASTWQSEMGTYGNGDNIGTLTVTSGPRQQ